MHGQWYSIRLEHSLHDNRFSDQIHPYAVLGVLSIRSGKQAVHLAITHAAAATAAPCQELKAKADLMERRLVAAERLIAGLGSERERWSRDIEALEAAREQLVGDCLLTSAFLSYTGEGGIGMAVSVLAVCLI